MKKTRYEQMFGYTMESTSRKDIASNMHKLALVFCDEMGYTIPCAKDFSGVYNFLYSLRLWNSENAKNDDGIVGKCVECAICSFLSNRIIYLPKLQGCSDLISKEFGKVEIKTALGSLGNTIDEYTKSKKDRVDTIFYAPHIFADEVPYCMYIFTREQWQEVVKQENYEAFGGTGKLLDWNAKMNQPRFQSFKVTDDDGNVLARPKSSGRIYRYLCECCCTVESIADHYNL